MARTRYLTLIGGVAVATVTLASCSSAPPTGGSTGGAADKVAKIVIVSPLSGGNAAVGLSARNGAVLAITKANEAHAVPGWTLQVESVDDKNDKPTAAALARKAAADDQVAGVVGSVYSGLTKAMLPELAKDPVPTISPTATNPTLTKGDDFATAAARQFPFFYRVIAPDDAHAPAVANYLKAQGITSVATASDGDSYGTGLVAAFKRAFTGRIVDVGTVSTTDPDYSPTVARVLRSKPQAVFFGGADPEGGRLSLQVKRAGLIVPLAGGDGLGADGFIPMAGPIAAGDVSTKAGEPLDKVEAGRQFLADYAAAGFDEPPSSFSALAYDAATAMINGLKKSLPGATSPKGSRAATVKAIAGVKFDGTGGPVAFDEYGDVTPRVVTVQVLQGGKWTPAKTYSF